MIVQMMGWLLLVLCEYNLASLVWNFVGVHIIKSRAKRGKERELTGGASKCDPR